MSLSLVDADFSGGENTVVLQLIYLPGLLARLCGCRPRNISYIGGGTVWRLLPDRTRASTRMEIMLSRLEARARFYKTGRWP